MKNDMKQRYSVFPRAYGVYYYQDNTTGKQGTLKTRDKDEAYRLVAAKNENEEDRASAAIWRVSIGRLATPPEPPAHGSTSWTKSPNSKRDRRNTVG